MVLVVVAAAFAGYYNVLICHTDPGMTSGVQTNIADNPDYDTVDLVDCRSYTPSVAEMENYRCVFVWTNYALGDPSGFGDNLADFMDYGYGYGVVSCCFAHSSGGNGIAGRYASDPAYCPLTRGYDNYNYTSLGAYDDYSYIMFDVEEVWSIYYWQSVSTESGATWIADLTNGTDMAAINANENAVAINLYPGDYREWSGDGWILYNNAIRYMMDGGEYHYVDVDCIDPFPGDSGVPVDTDIVFACISAVGDGFGCIDTDTIVFTAEDQSRRSGDGALHSGSSSLSTRGNPKPAGEISGTLDIDDSDESCVICTFTPDEDLPVDRITCTVDGCLADTDGYMMGEDFVWTFSTGNYGVEQTTWGAIKAGF
jgi:hypothetical protein